MTSKHQLELHVAQPDQDYHDWQNRCRSVGPVFNPFKVRNLFCFVLRFVPVFNVLTMLAT